MASAVLRGLLLSSSPAELTQERWGPPAQAPGASQPRQGLWLGP